MTGDDLKAKLDELDWTQADLARVFDVWPSTITTWAKSPKIPKPVAAFITLLDDTRKHRDGLTKRLRPEFWEGKI